MRLQTHPDQKRKTALESGGLRYEVGVRLGPGAIPRSFERANDQMSSRNTKPDFSGVSRTRSVTIESSSTKGDIIRGCTLAAPEKPKQHWNLMVSASNLEGDDNRADSRALARARTPIFQKAKKCEKPDSFARQLHFARGA